MPNLNELNPTNMEMDDINDKLQAQISRDIQLRKRLLEKRAFAHAQAMFPIEDLILEPPDYGLGVIPKLFSVDNTNDEAHRIIDECNTGIVKLSVIQRLLNSNNTGKVLILLNNNKYYTAPIEDIKKILGSVASVEEILCS